MPGFWLFPWASLLLAGSPWVPGETGQDKGLGLSYKPRHSLAPKALGPQSFLIPQPQS